MESKGSQAHPEDSFSGMYKKYYRLVLYFFNSRNYHPEDAHDMTQETFLRAYKSLENFRGDASLKNWLLVIASNLLISDIKKKSPLSGNHSKVMNIDFLDNINAQNFDDFDVHEDLVMRQRKKRLEHAMASLSPRMRHCISLRILHDFKYTEIALIMQIKTNTVKSLLFQARQKLKDLIAKEGSLKP